MQVCYSSVVLRLFKSWAASIIRLVPHFWPIWLFFYVLSHFKRKWVTRNMKNVFSYFTFTSSMKPISQNKFFYHSITSILKQLSSVMQGNVLFLSPKPSLKLRITFLLVLIQCLISSVCHCLHKTGCLCNCRQLAVTKFNNNTQLKIQHCCEIKILLFISVPLLSNHNFLTFLRSVPPKRAEHMWKLWQIKITTNAGASGRFTH